MGRPRSKLQSKIRNAQKEWKLKNPPIDGYYICWICNQTVSAGKVTVDHVATVEMYPEYATELSNMKPAHEWCNQVRGKQQHTGVNNWLGKYWKDKKWV